LKLSDASNKSVSGRLFFGCSLCVPGLAPLNFFGSIKWRKTKFLGIRRLVLDVKPPSAPALDGVGELYIKVSDFGTDTNAYTTYVVDDVFQVVTAEVEDVFPEAPVRVDAQETFTECNESGDVEERVWGQLVQLDSVDKEKATKKFVDRNREVANEEIDKSYRETNRRKRRTVTSGFLGDEFFF
jgi:hypothetical protein